jgi:glucose/mannose-6-phosphate isomerase
VLAVLASAKVVDPGEDLARASAVLAELAADLGPAVPEHPNEAKAVARWLGERIPVIWGSEGVSEAAAWRWKCAFNENAEVPAFSSALPELDHHEVVGWAEGRGTSFALLVLREEGEHRSVGPRIAATLEEVAASGIVWREVWGRGDTPLSRALSLMLLGDTASAYHALGRGVDPAPIEAIARLKARLEGGG